MQKHLTYDGKSTMKLPPRSIQLVLTNDTDVAQHKLLVASAAREKVIGYNNTILKEGNGCEMVANEHFKTLAQFQNFVKGYPVELLSVSITPITSSNYAEQLAAPVRIKTPAFGEDLIEVVAGQASGMGNYQYPLHNVLLGDPNEVEITIQPKNSFTLTLELGGYNTRRLIPAGQ